MLPKHRFAAAAVLAIAAASLVAADSADALPRGHGSRSRTVEWTGQNGRHRTTDANRTWNRREGVATRDRTTTFNDGSQRSVDVDRLRTGPGEYSVSREVTGRNGDTRAQTGDISVARTENGRSVTGDINTTNHGQVDYARDVSHQDGVRTVDASATFEDGSAISRTSSGSCANATCSSSGVITGRNGHETTWDQSRTRTDDGAVASRDVTFADGSTRSVDHARTGNGDGTGSVTRTVTGRNGETRTQTGDYVISRNP
jgi:hypothetical protein